MTKKKEFCGSIWGASGPAKGSQQLCEEIEIEERIDEDGEIHNEMSELYTERKVKYAKKIVEVIEEFLSCETSLWAADMEAGVTDLLNLVDNMVKSSLPSKYEGGLK